MLFGDEPEEHTVGGDNIRKTDQPSDSYKSEYNYGTKPRKQRNTKGLYDPFLESFQEQPAESVEIG